MLKKNQTKQKDSKTNTLNFHTHMSKLMVKLYNTLALFHRAKIKMIVVECIQVLSSALTLNQYSSILQSLSTLTCLKETGSFNRILC